MNYYDWDKVAAELEHFQSLRDCSDLALDAMYGTVMELRWRGNWLDYEGKGGWLTVVNRTIRRLLAMPSMLEYPKQAMLPLPSIGLGTYGWKYNIELIYHAIDKGIRLIDTAEGYGFGRVELALKPVASKVIISDKVARTHLAYKSIINACERSLLRLGIDCIPLYQIHYPNPDYPIEESMAAMNDLVLAGKIQYIGLSNHSLDQLWTAQYYSPEPIRFMQMRYNPVDRFADKVRIPFCQAYGLNVLGYSPFVQGNIFKGNNTTAQVILRGLLGEGITLLPRTNRQSHLEDILEVYNYNESCTS